MLSPSYIRTLGPTKADKTFRGPKSFFPWSCPRHIFEPLVPQKPTKLSGAPKVFFPWSCQPDLPTLIISYFNLNFPEVQFRIPKLKLRPPKYYNFTRSMFFFIIYSGFVSSLKNSKLLPRKRPSPITITKLAWHWVATVEGQTNNLVLRSHFPVRLSIIQSWIIARSCVCGMAVLISLHFSYVQGRCFNVCKSPMEELFSWSAQCFRRTVQLRP